MAARDLPESWTIDDNVDRDGSDTSAFEALEFVACAVVDSTSDSGRVCSFTSFDGEDLDLAVMNGTFDLTIYEAATGNVVRTMPIRSNIFECPSSLIIEGDQTELLEGPSTEDFEEMLSPTVEPR